MTNEEAQEVLDELQNVRPEILNAKAKRLFDAIMLIADQRDMYKSILNELENYLYEKNNNGYEKVYLEDIFDKLKDLKEQK